MSLKAATAREYRTRYGMEMPTLKLARIMFTQNKALFKNVEEARERLRYIESKSGKGKSKCTNVGKEFIMQQARPKTLTTFHNQMKRRLNLILSKDTREVLSSTIFIYHTIVLKP